MATLGLCVCTTLVGTLLHHVVFWSLIDQGPLHVTVRNRPMLHANMAVFGVLCGLIWLVPPLRSAAGFFLWCVVAAGYVMCMSFGAVTFSWGLVGLTGLQLLAHAAASGLVYRLISSRLADEK